MRLLTLIFLFVWTVSLKAQTNVYSPFPDSNGIWINGYYVLVTDPFYHYVLVSTENYCTTGQDTLINNINYTKVNFCEGGYKAAIRNDNGRVYFVPHDSVNELLLYDFTLQQGDTIDDFYYITSGGSLGVLNNYTVGYTDSVLLNGFYHKRMDIGGAYWIEGIGCSQGLFIEPFPNVSGTASELLCMSYNDTTLFPQVSYSSCLATIGITESYEEVYKIFPNPASNQISIESTVHTPQSTVEILNTLGQMVHQSAIQNPKSEIDVSGFSKGVYLLRVKEKEEAVFWEKLVVE